MDTDELQKRIVFVAANNPGDVSKAASVFGPIRAKTDMEAIIFSKNRGDEDRFYITVFPFFSNLFQAENLTMFLQTPLFNAFATMFPSVNVRQNSNVYNSVARMITFNEHDTAMLKLMSLGIDQWQR